MMTIRTAELGERGIRLFALLCVLALAMGCGPIGPFSSGRLSGDERDWPADWNQIADVTEIQLETSPRDPYSVNVWFVVVDGDAYLATSLLMGTEVPDEREWVRNILSDPHVRIRIEGILYPARLESVADSALRALVFEAFQRKYPKLEESRGDAALFFWVAKRTPVAMP
jgi:hypothetical protein